MIDDKIVYVVVEAQSCVYSWKLIGIYTTLDKAIAGLAGHIRAREDVAVPLVVGDELPMFINNYTIMKYIVDYEDDEPELENEASNADSL